MCQETWPDKPEILYGQPFEFYESLGEPQIHDVSGLEYRHEWRAYFEHTLGLRPKVDQVVIPGANQRLAER